MTGVLVSVLIIVLLLAWWVFAALLVARCYFVLQSRRTMQPGGPLR